MIAYLFVAIFCFAQVCIAEKFDRLQFFCEVNGGVDFAELIFSEKIYCIQDKLGSGKWICGITNDEVTAKGHIKFSDSYKGGKKDAIVFHAVAENSNLMEQKCYSCNTEQDRNPDSTICHGYNALDYSLNKPSTCAGPGNVFLAGKNYYFETFLPVNMFKEVDNEVISVKGKDLGSPINCKLEIAVKPIN